MKAGYVRGVYSSAEVQRILRAFDDASCKEVVINARPHKNHLFERLVRRLDPGDTLAVWTLECAAANSEDLIGLVADLNGKQIGFESIVEGFVAPPDSFLSPIMIADQIDRIRSRVERPDRHHNGHRVIRPARAKRGAAPRLITARAR